MKKLFIIGGLLLVMQPLLFANYGPGNGDVYNLGLDSITTHLQLNDHEARLDFIELDSITIHKQLDNHELRLDNVELDSVTIHSQLNDHETRLDNVDNSSAADHLHLNNLEARTDDLEADSITIHIDLNAYGSTLGTHNTALNNLSLSTGIIQGNVDTVAASTGTAPILDGKGVSSAGNGSLTLSSITAQMERQFTISLSSPMVGTVKTKVAKTTWTLEEVTAYAGVPPAGANMTITVTTGTTNATNTGWLTGTSLGTLTIVNGKIQSNNLVCNQVIDKDVGMVQFQVTAIGSTANNTGYDIDIVAMTKW